MDMMLVERTVVEKVGWWVDMMVAMLVAQLVVSMVVSMVGWKVAAMAGR